MSVKGIVTDDQGRILLARENDDAWDLLGGGLEHNENPLEGLKREIMEETGLTVVSVSPSPKYFVTAPRRHHSSFVANVIYEIKLADLNFTPSDECQELRFFSVKEMAEVELFPNVQKLYELLAQ